MRLRRKGPLVRKRAGADGERIAALTEWLIRAGIRTPDARFDAPSGDLVMPWLDGRPGHEVLRSNLDPGGVSAQALAPFAAVLVQLHAAPLSDVQVPAFDPFAKVDPRLADQTKVPQAILQAALSARAAASTAISAFAAQAPTLNHGDYHAGQLLFGADGPPWLLDLEDVALGDREADLANFSAHLATSGWLASADIASTFLQCLEAIRAAYRDAGGGKLSNDRAIAHGAAALLRRGLKLWQQDGDAARTQEIVAAAMALAQLSASAGQRSNPNLSAR